MREARFLCLAVSRRESGNCIAGIDIDSGEWLRPIHSCSRAAFGDAELVVEDNHTHQTRFMAPLDLLSVPLEEHTPTHSQPENWTVAANWCDTTHPVLRTCRGERTVAFLSSKVDHCELLLGSPGDSLRAADLATHQLSHSLALVQPADLAWRVSPSPKYAGKVQVRAEFKFGALSYSLVVTDPVWESRCQTAGMGKHCHSELSAKDSGLMFLTVSLSAIAFHGLHYKLAAGVIELHKLLPEHDKLVHAGAHG